MKLSPSIKALLTEMVRKGHGLPDYVFHVGQTEGEVVERRPLCGAPGTRDLVSWAEEYRIVGYSSIFGQPYKGLARVYWNSSRIRGEYPVGSAMVQGVELVGLRPEELFRAPAQVLAEEKEEDEEVFLSPEFLKELRG